MLKIKCVKFYKVKGGQTIEEIAAAFSVSAWLLVKENHLTTQPYAGQILTLPAERGNAYTAQAGESKALLCGSEENFIKKNGTDVVYPGMRVIL